MVIDISKIINDKLNEMDTSGVIEEYIREQTEKTVKMAIEDSFGSYDFKKAVQGKIRENFPEIVGNIGLHAYNQYLADTVRKLIIAGMEEDAADKITEAVKEILCKKRENIKLSELIKEYHSCMNDYEEDEKHERNEENDGFLCNLKKRNGYAHDTFNYYSLYLDTEGDKELEDIEDIDIVVKFDSYWATSKEQKTTIADIYFRGTRITKEFVHHHPDRFEQLLLNLYLNKTPVIMDVENYKEDDHYYETMGDY